jgi:hypothetical protein
MTPEHQHSFPPRFAATLCAPVLAVALVACGDGRSSGLDGAATDELDTLTGSDEAPDASEDGPGDDGGDSGAPDDTGDDGATEDGESGGGEDSGPVGVCGVSWEFETCDEGWTTGKAHPDSAESTWACGDPNGEDEPGLSGGFRMGQWATGPGGDYNQKESSYLASPSFSLADCEADEILLVVDHWWFFGWGCTDGGVIQASIDGGNEWTTVTPTWHGYGTETLSTALTPPNGELGFCKQSESWILTLADLSDLGGEADVRVRFVMGAGEWSHNPGWYINRVAIETY